MGGAPPVHPPYTPRAYACRRGAEDRLLRGSAFDRAVARALAVALAVVMPVCAAAQDVLGRSVIGGRTVVILSDGTWRFEDAAETASDRCSQVADGLTFCGGDGDWTPFPPPSSVIDAAYAYDDRLYGQIISEGIGTADGATMVAVRATVLNNAAGASGVTVADIPVLSVEPCAIDGIDGERVVYSAAFDGLGFVFANCMILRERQIHQVMTYEVGTRRTDRHDDLHEAFLGRVRIARGDL